MDVTSTEVPTQPQDAAVTVQACGAQFLVSVMHRHPDGLRAVQLCALVPKTSRDVAELERQAIRQTIQWLEAVASRLPV